jgi:hypothetical protein
MSEVSFRLTLGLSARAVAAALVLCGDRARAEKEESIVRAISIRCSDCRLIIEYARVAELPSPSTDLADGYAESAGVYAISWNRKDYGVVQRVGRGRVQLRHDEHRS